MNNEDFVTYKQAVRLKELGFDWEVLCYYTLNDVNEPKLCREPFELGGFNNHNKYNKCWSAPTLAQAAKWLRGKGIDIDITLFRDIDARGDNPVIKRYYNCEIAFDEDDEDLYEDFASYEQALSAGIDKALKLIINHEITDTI